MFRTVPLSIIRSVSLYTQQTCTTYTIAVCTVKNSWLWTEELSETCKILFPNKVEKLVHLVGCIIRSYRGADKSLARTGRQNLGSKTGTRDSNNIETRAVINFFPLQRKAPKETNAILTERVACVLPGRAKDLSAPMHIIYSWKNKGWFKKMDSIEE